MNKHTPGPWQWFEAGERSYLATPDRGRLYVMGFARKGMQGACPRFATWTGIETGVERERLGGIMEDGINLRDGMLHPDARLIAAAPLLLDSLARAYYRLADVHNSWPGRDTPAGQTLLCNMRDALAEATGLSDQEVQEGALHKAV